MPKLKYRVSLDAFVDGEMDVPQEVVDRIPEGDAWSDEIEKMVLEHWDGARLEIDPSNDGEVSDVRITE